MTILSSCQKRRIKRRLIASCSQLLEMCTRKPGLLWSRLVYEVNKMVFSSIRVEQHKELDSCSQLLEMCTRKPGLLWSRLVYEVNKMVFSSIRVEQHKELDSCSQLLEMCTKYIILFTRLFTRLFTSGKFHTRLTLTFEISDLVSTAEYSVRFRIMMRDRGEQTI